MKEIAELSILYGNLIDWTIEKNSPALARIQTFLLTFLGDPKIAEWVRKIPAHYSPYVVAYLPLRSIGLRLPAFEEALPILHRAGYPAGLETTPYRELEMQHLLWKAGVSPRRPNCGLLYRRTTMARCRNPIYYSVAEVYSLTHTLFYLTDIAGPAAHLPQDECARAITILEPLVVHYWRKPDWDLTGELLLNLVALDRAETPLFAAAFRALLSAWRDDGALPAPKPEALAPDAAPRAVVQHFYHTTLVGVILCAAYLYRNASEKKVQFAQP